jgi:DNA-directed RNA polymerase specialized sigma24 family protein
MYGDARFPTTRWSLVLAARHADAPGARAALSSLCEQYWQPVFAYVRRQGYADDEAQDLTQGFFARLIEKAYVADADQNRGRFRAFLLTSCRHYLLNEVDRERAQKRGGGLRRVAIDDIDVIDAETPERVYQRQWSRALLAAVLDDVRKRYVADGGERLFDRLSVFLTSGEEAGTHAAAAIDLAMTPGAVKVAIHRLRRRYRQVLWRRVAETVASESEVEDEIRILLASVAP